MHAALKPLDQAIIPLSRPFEGARIPLSRHKVISDTEYLNSLRNHTHMEESCQSLAHLSKPTFFSQRFESTLGIRVLSKDMSAEEIRGEYLMGSHGVRPHFELWEIEDFIVLEARNGMSGLCLNLGHGVHNKNIFPMASGWLIGTVLEGHIGFVVHLDFVPPAALRETKNNWLFLPYA